MRTQVDEARNGTITPQVKRVARDEGIDPELLRDYIASGRAVIMQRGKRCVGIGKDLRTKINVNIGTSTGRTSLAEELEKARIAGEFGADTLSDLSMAGEIKAIRAAILAATPLPLTTVPIYQAVAEHGLEDLTTDIILDTIRSQAEQGVNSFVLHCVSTEMLKFYQKKQRIMGIVSKGGSITSAFMLKNRCPNPFVDNFDEVLSICRKHDIVLSLGNTARSGCINDPRDALQREETRENAKLAHRAHEEGVQVIIEGCGGHIRSNRIARYIRDCKKASPFPLFVAGPLPTDIGAGYDHIAGAIGASTASAAGADYLCYITPAEHLGLPTPAAVKEGLIAFRIAAHVGDTVKYRRDTQDRKVAGFRAALDREGEIRCAMDPERARELSDGAGECTMCGKFCAIKIMREYGA